MARNLQLVLQLLARDTGSKVLKQALQDISRDTKAAQKTDDELAKSRQQNSTTAIRASRYLQDEYRRASSARSTLGIRSERDIQREIQQTMAAYIRDTQSELIAIITAAAIEPESTAGQLLAALNKLYAPLNDTLGALSSLVGGANKLPYFTAANAAALTVLSSIGRDIIGKATVAEALAMVRALNKITKAGMPESVRIA